MEKIDQTYLNNLVSEAGKGSSNAFAELFSAVYKRHWIYLGHMYDGADRAESALKEMYVKILKSISGLARPVLFMPWSCRIAFRLWAESLGLNDDTMLSTPAGNYSLTQIERLPVTEGQVLAMHYFQGISLREIADILNFHTPLVKQAVRSAFKHLKAVEEKDSADVRIEDNEPVRGSVTSRPDEELPARLLEEIFDECGKKPNTVPLEALKAYTVYRRERFSLQRIILIAAMVLFLFLPFFFIIPRYEVGSIAEGKRGLPVYTIRVSSRLPLGSVNARLNKHILPVYEADSRTYTVEPTRNGNLNIEVELFNRQSVQKNLEVTDVDNTGPVLTGNEIRGGNVVLKVKDEGIGVDYRAVYAVSESGEAYHPVSADPEKGEVIFIYPEEVWDVYIPDHIGNMLHLTFTFE